MQIVILPTANDVAAYGASLFIRQLTQKPNSVLGLATGSTPVALYQKLIESYQQERISFQKTTTFNLDEYLGLQGDHPQSYRHFMNQHLFEQVDVDPNLTHVPPGNASNPISACEEYERMIENSGGIDLQLLGIGRNGHIGFNEPSSGLRSRTRVKTLTQETIDDNARFFSKGEFQPHLSITMGIGTILDSRQVLLLATGSGKAEAIRDTIEGPMSASCPASALQMHQSAIIVIDEEAASRLDNANFYKHIERENQALMASLGID
ncbi:MAG: glucosamine-6-phosphate deaminase [Cellvibrionaceae bacterium]